MYFKLKEIALIKSFQDSSAKRKPRLEHDETTACDRSTEEEGLNNDEEPR